MNTSASLDMAPTAGNAIDFRSRAFLLSHVRYTLAFYAPTARDPSGGFFHSTTTSKTTAGSTTVPRAISSAARASSSTTRWAYRHFGDARYLEDARYAFAFLRDAHWDSAFEGYDWEIEWRDGQKRTLDGTRHCYGMAFVLLACAHAAMAGIDEAKPMIDETFALMEHHFWDPHAGLYADEATPDWNLSDYRGQNANMHATEALLAAYEATGHVLYLDRAEKIAGNITLRQARLSNGLIWEHFDRDWSVDWHYNESDSSNIFRPWGFQPGHQTEWAKLLLILERHRKLPWLAPRAVELFDAGFNRAWDSRHAGCITASARTIPSAITTSISGCRQKVSRRRRRRRRCSARARDASVSGTATTNSGVIAGCISSITNTARGIAF